MLYQGYTVYRILYPHQIGSPQCKYLELISNKTSPLLREHEYNFSYSPPKNVHEQKLLREMNKVGCCLSLLWNGILFLALNDDFGDILFIRENISTSLKVSYETNLDILRVPSIARPLGLLGFLRFRL